MSVTAYHFWSPTCVPCKHIKDYIEDLKDVFSQVKWVSVNIQNDPNDYMEKFNVKVVPTMVVVGKNGVHRHSGTSLGLYRSMLDNAVKA